MILYAMIALGIGLGFFMPLRWGVLGFLAACVVLFAVQVGIHTAGGYEGLPFEETMLLFNDSWASYVGYNAQITYRAFALPMLGLAGVLVWRLGRGV